MIKCLTYSLKEVSELLGVSYTTVYNLVIKGEIPFIKIGGQYFISRSDFDKWFNELKGWFEIEGPIVKRGKKYSFVYYAYNSNGEKSQQWVSGFNTKKEAEDYQREYNRKIKKSSVKIERIKVGKYLDKYLTICEKQKGLSPNTLNGYSVNIRHIKSIIGDYYLEDITADLLDELFYKLSEKGLSGTSQLYIYRVLHSAFEMGVKRREIYFNYCDMIEPPKKDKFQPIIILNDNLFKFFDYLNSYNIKYYWGIMCTNTFY